MARPVPEVRALARRVSAPAKARTVARRHPWRRGHCLRVAIAGRSHRAPGTRPESGQDAHPVPGPVGVLTCRLDCSTTARRDGTRDGGTMNWQDHAADFLGALTIFSLLYVAMWWPL